MRDAEITGDVWTIPADRAKNGEAHAVPLSTAAQAVLAGVRRIRGAGYLFTTNGASPVSGFAKAKARLDKLMGEACRAVRDPRPAAYGGVGMARLAIPPHVVEAVLNHRTGTVSGVAKVYNRFTYDAEKRAALEAWGRYVLGMSAECQENVVPLQKPRGW